MRKICTGIALVNLLLSTNSFGYSNVSVPISTGGFGFGIQALVWRPTINAFQYGITFPNLDSFNNGTVRQVDPDYDLGVKAYISYSFPCTGTDIRLAYTHFDHEYEKGLAIKRPARLIPFGAGSPVNVVRPSAPVVIRDPSSPIGVPVPPLPARVISTLDANLAGARVNFEQNTWDLDVGQAVNIGCNFHIRYFAGLRYANLDTHFSETINGTNVATGSEFLGTLNFGILAATDVVLDFEITSNEQDLIKQKSDFNGIGPRLGIDANYDLGHGFSIVSSLATSLIVGEIERSLNQNQALTNSFETILGATGLVGDVPTDLIATFPDGATTTALPDETNVRSFHFPDETRVIPNIDAKLGLAYTYQFCNCSHTRLGIEAGYMVNHFFNAFDKLADISIDRPEFRANNTSDISFDGPYVGINLNL